MKRIDLSRRRFLGATAAVWTGACVGSPEAGREHRRRYFENRLREIDGQLAVQ